MFQLQPEYMQKKRWLDFANRNGCTFETLELYRLLSTLEPEERERMLLWYSSCGLVRSVHGAFIDVNPFSGDRDFADLSRRKVMESCEAAARIGAQNIVFHSSCFPTLRGEYLRNHATAAADFYSELATQFHLNVFLENSFDLDPVPLRSVMEQVTVPSVRICLDIGHANLSRADLDTWFAELEPYIGYLHLSDNNGDFDEHIPLGTGSVNWSDADRLYRGLCRPIPVTLETGSLENTEISLRFLNENHYFL